MPKGWSLGLEVTDSLWRWAPLLRLCTSPSHRNGSSRERRKLVHALIPHIRPHTEAEVDTEVMEVFYSLRKTHRAPPTLSPLKFHSAAISWG